MENFQPSLLDWTRSILHLAVNCRAIFGSPFGTGYLNTALCSKLRCPFINVLNFCYCPGYGERRMP